MKPVIFTGQAGENSQFSLGFPEGTKKEVLEKTVSSLTSIGVKKVLMDQTTGYPLLHCHLDMEYLCDPKRIGSALAQHGFQLKTY